MKKPILLITIISFFSTTAFSKNYESEGSKFKVEKIFEGKDVVWGFDFINPKSADEMIFSERDGKLKYLNLKTSKSHEIAGVPPVFAKGQGGLLDVYFHQPTQDLFLTYSEPVGKGATTSLFKGRLSSDKKKLEGQKIFQAQAIATTAEHFGSRIAIDKNGSLFMTVGERNQRERAQTLSNHQGKIIRLTLEGKALPDNPFTNVKGALPEIWSYGHRNPQGLIIDPEGALLEVEFGPRGGDEVNLIKKGENYGWPVITYGKEYWGPTIGPEAKEGMIQPLYHWTPSINPSGIALYTDKVFPKFTGNLFLATLAGNHLHRIVMDKDRKMLKEEELLNDMEERFRQVKAGPDGLIYLSTDSGKIFRLRPL